MQVVQGMDEAVQLIVAKAEGRFNDSLRGKPRPYNGFGPETAPRRGNQELAIHNSQLEGL
jgi:hypothetical protein